LKSFERHDSSSRRQTGAYLGISTRTRSIWGALRNGARERNQRNTANEFEIPVDSITTTSLTTQPIQNRVLFKGSIVRLRCTQHIATTQHVIPISTLVHNTTTLHITSHALLPTAGATAMNSDESYEAIRDDTNLATTRKKRDKV
jgi:hypothetical protein